MKRIIIPMKANLLNKNGYTKLFDYLKNKNINNKFKVLNKDNKNISINYLNNLKKNIFKVTTNTGNIFYIDNNTKINCLSLDGNIYKKTINDILPSDEIISKVGDIISSSKELITEENAYLLGYFYGIRFDEIIKSTNEYLYIPCYNSLIDKLKELLINQFDLIIKDNELYIYNSKVNIDNFIRQFDYNENHIPNLVKSSNVTSQIAFIQGFYDVYTSLEKNSIRKEIINSAFFDDLLLLLKNLGILAEKKSEFIIRGEEVLNFYNLINFSNIDYEDMVLNFSLNKEDFYIINALKKVTCSFYNTVINKTFELNDNFEYTRNNVEKLLELNGDKNLKNTILELLNENFCYDRIKNIEILKNEDCIEIELEDNSNIILDSIIIE